MKDLTKGKTFKVILVFTIPLVLSGLMTQTYNLIDLIVAGKCIGSDALSATGCTTTLIQFLSSLFWGLGVSVATLSGEYYGEKNYKNIVKLIKTTFVSIFVLMFILCLTCILFATPILTLLEVDPLIFDSAKSYFQIFMVALFIQAISYQATCVIQSLGNSKFPLLITAISGLSNLVLNIIFVMVFNLGVNGLAYATVISSLIALIANMIKIKKTIIELGGNLKFEYSISTLKTTLKLAVPCILQQCSLYLSSIAVQPYINGLGKDVSAGYSIAMNINLLINAIYHSFSRAVASYVSQSKGAGKYENFAKGIKIGIVQQIMLMTPLVLICFLLPEEICGIFMKDNDIACLPYATQFITVCIPFIIFVAFGNLMHSFYKAVEATKSVLLSTFLFTVARIILTYTLPNTKYIFSVYLALSLAWVIEAIIMIIIYLLGKWKSKEQIDFEKSL